MCVIAIKPTGVDFPTDQRIKEMWDKNSDGAGFMYTKDNSVFISKGFMNLDDLMKNINELKETVDVKETPIILHFRITTHGGTSPENTHPFPLSSDEKHLKALDVKCLIGMAHNGVINAVPKEDTLSDTQVFVRDIVNPLKNIDPKSDFLNKYQTTIDVVKGVSSKLAFLDNKGVITTFGDFKESSDKDGLKYSNLSFEPYKYTSSLSTYKEYSPSYGYDDDDDDDFGYIYDTKTYTYKKKVDKKVNDDDETYKDFSNFDIGFYEDYNLYRINSLAETFRVPKSLGYTKYDVVVYFECKGKHYFYDLKRNRITEAIKAIYLTAVGENDLVYEDEAFLESLEDAYENIDTFIQSNYILDSEVNKTKNNVVNNIGGRKNKETKYITINADRKKLTQIKAKSIKLNRIKVGTELRYENLKYKGTIKVESKNWYYSPTLTKYLYKQKDGAFIVVDQIKNFYSKKTIDLKLSIDKPTIYMEGAK